MTVQKVSNHAAILVIHGIGEQNPFDTLDDFSRGVIKKYSEQGYAVEASHLCATRHSGGEDWVEHYISLGLTRGGVRRQVDLHEFYWAYMTEERISLAEVMEWMNKTIDKAIGASSLPKKLQDKYHEHGGMCFTGIALPIKVLIWFFSLFDFLPTSWQPMLKKVRDWFGTHFQDYIVGYLGDVAIYTATDEKSRYYRIRQDILASGQALLEAILKEERCDRVVIAGHSLGSAIAYDMLNRLNIRANLDPALPLNKIQGLITFGSPLDKIAYVFREKIEGGKIIKAQIIEHLHSFKINRLLKKSYPVPVRNPFLPRLNDVRWLNYYKKEDKVSDFLVFYDIPEKDNIKLAATGDGAVHAHLSYWEDDAFYQDFMGKLEL